MKPNFEHKLWAHLLLADMNWQQEKATNVPFNLGGDI